MHTCSVISCDSNSQSKNVKLFRIPSDDEDAKGWIHFITEANSGVIPCKSSRRIFVCSKHFRKCCIYPCNVQRSKIINGHYPSVVDGKAIINVKSKCALISADEQLQVYTRPNYRSTYEKQRAYLVKQLTSFSVQRKIVIGKGIIMNPGNERSGTVREKENLVESYDLFREETLTSLNSSVSSHPEKSVRLTRPPNGANWNKVNKKALLVNVQNGMKTNELSSCKEAGTSAACAFPPDNLEEPKSIHVGLKKSLKRARPTCPSSETKMKLLIRDNYNLKKSVHTLEKRIEDMEKEIKRFKDVSYSMDACYKKIMKDTEKRLNQNKRKVDQNFGISKITNCKCAPIEVVDIS